MRLRRQRRNFFLIAAVAAVAQLLALAPARTDEPSGGGADISGSCSVSEERVAYVSLCVSKNLFNKVKILSLVPLSLLDLPEDRRLIPVIDGETSTEYLHRLVSGLNASHKDTVADLLRSYPLFDESSAPDWARLPSGWNLSGDFGLGSSCKDVPAVRRLRRVCAGSRDDFAFVVESSLARALDPQHWTALQLEVALQHSSSGSPDDPAPPPEDPTEPEPEPISLPDILEIMTERE